MTEAGPKRRKTLPSSLRLGEATRELLYGFAEPDDAAACNTLNNALFRRNRTVEQWRWEFQPPFLPFDKLLYAVARDGENVIGTQGAILVPMISRNGAFWTTKGEDTMVSPRYWDRNVLVGMYELLVNFYKQNGIRLSWGFNASKASFSKVGFRYFAEPESFMHFRALDGGAADAVLAETNMKKRLARPGGAFVKHSVSLAATLLCEARGLGVRSASIFTRPKGLVVEAVSSSPGEEFDSLSSRFVGTYGGITIHRRPDFLKWRLLDNPFLASRIFTARVGGELYGYLACTVPKDGAAYISDQLICAPGGDMPINRAIAEALLSAAVSQARSDGASAVGAHSYNGHPAALAFRSALGRSGFLARRWEVGACHMPLPEAGALPDDIANYDSWFVTRMYSEGRLG